MILKDDTGSFDVKEYKGIDEILSADWTATNKDYIELAFMGTPSKVICIRIDTTAVDYSEALQLLGFMKFNYLAIPEIESADVTSIVTWIKGKRTNDKKTYKAVLPNASTGDDEGIINFATADIAVGAKTYTTAEYTARIAGILAGLPFTRSATYFVLPEVSSITESTTPDDDIDAGKLILINDGEKIKIGRAVTPLLQLLRLKQKISRRLR